MTETFSSPTNSFRIKGVSHQNLFVSQCRCGEMNIHGFWDQLEKEPPNLERKTITVLMPCQKCGEVHRRTFRLTKGRALRPRLFSWIVLFFRVVHLVPKRFYRATSCMVLWLEKRFPI